MVRPFMWLTILLLGVASVCEADPIVWRLDDVRFGACFTPIPSDRTPCSAGGTLDRVLLAGSGQWPSD
jgi:hypothetical protein